MGNDYVPNEKYRNMFGVERSGYGMERVDLYLAQLEVAFKKIREDNRTLKRELSDREMGRPAVGLMPQEVNGPQEMYIVQLQAQLGETQAQLAEEQERGRQLAGKLDECQAQVQRLLGQLAELNAARLQQPELLPEPQAPQAMQSSVMEDLLAQISALRAEADGLRRQLRAQQQQQPAPMPNTSYSAVQAGFEEQTSLIGRVLVEARQQAEEMLRGAQQEAEQQTRKTRQRVEDLRAEHDRIYNQLQDISFALRSVLRDQGSNDYKRGEDFAAS